ncbi:hypothetical protein [Vaginisenegalia massiliensis]|uniref:hypothetical protein n=1 Tax=Vaginisenegalia massiliensis TaxID=2058294 RepID=UPI000F52BB73|nr:hypothetical protein [Vaginisenegalia massiliensis]
MIISPFIKIVNMVMKKRAESSNKMTFYRVELWSDHMELFDQALPSTIGRWVHLDEVTRCGLLKSALAMDQLMEALAEHYHLSEDDIELVDVTANPQKLYWEFFGFR